MKEQPMYHANQPTTLSFDVENQRVVGMDPFPNSLMQTVQDKGFVDVMNDMNRDSYQEQQDLVDDYQQGPSTPEEFYDEEQTYQKDFDERVDNPNQLEEKHKTKRKKTKLDKRFDDLTYRLSMKDDELRYKDEEIKRLQEIHEQEKFKFQEEYQTSLLASELSKKKEKITHDIERVSDIMVSAKDNEDNELYVKANQLLNKLMAQEVHNDSSMQQLSQNYYQAQNNYSEHDQFNQLAEKRFFDLSDSRELNSPYYNQWLQRNDYYNSHSPNFDNDLAEEVSMVKKDFNKFLKFNKKSDYIGTPEYYGELDNLISHKYRINQQNNSRNSEIREENGMQRTYVDVGREYDQSLRGERVPDGRPRYHTSDPENQSRSYSNPVAPVSRQGNGQQQRRLVPLDPIERQFALFMPSVDPQNPKRQLTDEEKIYNYQLGKTQPYTR